MSRLKYQIEKREIETWAEQLRQITVKPSEIDRLLVQLETGMKDHDRIRKGLIAEADKAAQTLYKIMKELKQINIT